MESPATAVRSNPPPRFADAHTVSERPAAAADVVNAATALLTRLDEITPDEFAQGGERLQREFLRSTLDILGERETDAPAATITAAPFTLGRAYPEHGGVYAGIVRAPAGQPDWHLFVPTDPAAVFAALAWGGMGYRETGAESNNDGLANTLALVASTHDHPAAKACHAVTIDGLSDFYLPARNELRICYANVPDLFAKDWHWSSTQYAGHSGIAWGQNFSNGGSSINGKDYEGRARAVRRLIIQ